MEFNGQLSPNGEFAQKVYALVAQIPQGRVMTYGQIAGICGNARAARIVGGIAHYGPPDLPWQRLVNKKGGLAAGYYGGRHQQKLDLEKEGIAVQGDEDTYFVNVGELLWSPGDNKLL